MSPGLAIDGTSVKLKEEEALLQEREGEGDFREPLGRVEREARFLRSKTTFFLPCAIIGAEGRVVSGIVFVY